MRLLRKTPARLARAKAFRRKDDTFRRPVCKCIKQKHRKFKGAPKYRHFKNNPFKNRNNEDFCSGGIYPDKTYIVCDANYNTSACLRRHGATPGKIINCECDPETYDIMILPENNPKGYSVWYGDISKTTKDIESKVATSIGGLYCDTMGNTTSTKVAHETIKNCAPLFERGTFVAVTLSIRGGTGLSAHELVSGFVNSLMYIPMPNDLVLRHGQTYAYKRKGQSMLMYYIRFVVTDEHIPLTIRPHKILESAIPESEVPTRYKRSDSTNGLYDLVKYYGFNKSWSFYYEHGSVDPTADLIVF